MQIFGGGLVGAVLPIITSAGIAKMKDTELENAYGIIGQMKVAEGKRDELISILAKGTRNMPGNLSYAISKDMNDENAIWITKYWETKDAHTASLQLESVQEAIGKGRSMINGFGHRFEVAPVAGM
ncbi:putative quinol monooxygenase [Sphingorhabdus sp. EL138]|uniref:putative quinol monooxygenase n=1 Tax=Sphingorhabdus sp. EL138 TaxID=2073156 RepID=UPI001C1F4260|nr:antibiotic biosynthesis monooxygenase family protein [Sphingorhabdus sp. EL138]